MENQEFDFIAIGDIVTDAFIRLKEASVSGNIDQENYQICLKFADKIPYESVTVVPAVGNSPNAAAAAARLGLRSALVSNLGDDYRGEEALAALRQNKVDTRFVTAHAGAKTNYHYVLWYLDDRTILIKHEEYPYALPLDFSRERSKPPRWVYLSSLGEHSLLFHQIIAEYLADNPEVKLAFQPGTYQIKFGKEPLAKIYERTEIFFCNTDEANRILGNEGAGDVKSDLRKIRELGPKIAVITDGKAGAYADDGQDCWFMPTYPDPAPPYERTGAGDAFSSTVVTSLALGKTLPEALRWGPINSMSVVQKVGAQAGLLNREQLENYLAQAPADYQPRKI